VRIAWPALLGCAALFPNFARADALGGGGEPHIASVDGTPVTIEATNPDQVIYLAKGEVDSTAAPDAFENVGVAPVHLKLAQGTYTVESSGSTSSSGHAVLRVGDVPVRVEVRTGDASVRTVGAVLIALGVTAIATGIIVVVSYTQKEGSYNKAAIAVPLFAGGGLALLGGFGMTLAGATRIVVPETAPGPALPPTQAAGPSIRWRF